jgi:hypothetical protein
MTAVMAWWIGIRGAGALLRPRWRMTSFASSLSADPSPWKHAGSSPSIHAVIARASSRLSDEDKRAFEQAPAARGKQLSAFARSAMALRCRELGVKIFPAAVK